LNKRQLEELFGLSTSTINRKLKDLPTIKIGNSRNSRVLFPRPEIDIFIRENFMNGSSKTSGGLS
jgi:predicted DNA-binding transcriptional regulator AlpA